MPYFEKVRKLSNVMFAVCALSLILTVIIASSSSFFPELIMYNFTNDLRGTIFTVVFLLLSLFTLLIATALRYIAKDTKDYVDREIKFK